MNDQLSIRVAWLYYLENLTQAEIGERLGLTRARVNRMLSEARENGLVPHVSRDVGQAWHVAVFRRAESAGPS